MYRSYRMLFILLVFALGFGACAPIRALRWWQPDLDDSSKFHAAHMLKATIPFRFKEATTFDRYQKLSGYLDTVLKGTNTNAFVVVKNDSIIYENYADQVNKNTLHPSFSVAKSYIGTLTGMLIDDGSIGSANDLVIRYLPELEKNDPRFRKLTLQHVLDMRAALDFDEDQETPFAGITKLYYGSALSNQVSKLKLKGEPGLKFEYQSMATQLLASVLERATGKTLQSLFSAYIWQPLGAESDALWSMDDHQTIKAFCCLNATARDFAKLGRLYLNKGKWEGKQLLSERWINQSTAPDTLFTKGYKNQFWAVSDTRYFKDSLEAAKQRKDLGATSKLRKNTRGNFYFSVKTEEFRAEGILGQIVYVNPKNNLIIVRMGNYPSKNIYFNGLIPEIGRKLNY